MASELANAPANTTVRVCFVTEDGAPVWVRARFLGMDGPAAVRVGIMQPSLMELQTSVRASNVERHVEPPLDGTREHPLLELHDGLTERRPW